MGTIGTFDSFTTARLGIYAAQHGLRVTGNNISNLNTDRYTRQRVDQKSFKTGGNDMYRSIFDNHVGNGALVTGINQVRDPYLDIRYRNTASDVGYTQTMLNGLKEIADTLDEVGKGSGEDGLLYAQLQDLADSLRRLDADPTKSNDTLVRTSAAALVKLFNTYAGKLDTLRENTIDDFKQKVSSVNEILTNIRNLNESIRKSEIHGDNALEMRDERNRQIDELSEYMHIKVEYSMEDVGAGKQVEKLTISLGDANPDPNSDTDETVLIDGIYGSQFSIRKVPVPNTDPATNATFPYLDKNGNPTDDPDLADMMDSPNFDLDVSVPVDSKGRQTPNAELRQKYPVELADNDLHGGLQAIRELLTEKGEFSTQSDVDGDINATTKRGIPYYQKSLDLLAKKFAEAYNELNQGTPVDENGDPITASSLTKRLPVVNDAGHVLDPVTGLYSDQGWTLDPATNYYVDKDGFFVGNPDHPVCNLDEVKIKPGYDEAATMAEINAKYPNSGYTTVADFLKAHAVKPGDTAAVTKDVPKGGVLFSNNGNSDDPEGITAANISIAHSWSTGDVHVVPTWTILFGGEVTNSTQGDNIGHMLSKINESLTYDPKELDDPNTTDPAVGKKLFQGSFNDMYSNMCTVLGNDQRVSNVQLNTHYTSLIELDTSRDGVSGVDLNDEAMNMMQFQKAYSAACRLMTAIDEVIERLINNTGLAGR